MKCQAQREDLAKLHLKRQGFDCFLPKTKTWRRLKGKSTQHYTAFFPGYIFVHIDLKEDRWRSINGTIGVKQIISFGLKPTPIPSGVIESLLGSADSDGIVQLDEVLLPGDEVRVLGGPFDRIKGIVEAATEKDRVNVLLQMMSREVSVSLPARELMVVR